MATASDEGAVLASSVDEGEGAVPPPPRRVAASSSPQIRTFPNNNAHGVEGDPSLVSQTYATSLAQSFHDEQAEDRSPSGLSTSALLTEEPSVPSIFNKRQKEEWSCTISSVQGSSNFAKYFREVSIDCTKVTEDLATTEAFQYVRTGNYVVCELCKRSGKSLRASLKGVKRSPSTHHPVLSNAIKHLKGNGSHTKIMEEDSKKVEAALQAKRKFSQKRLRTIRQIQENYSG